MRLTEKNIYEDFRLAYPKSKIRYASWFAVVKVYFSIILEEILKNGKVFLWPGVSMGFLAMIKIRPKLLNVLKSDNIKLFPRTKRWLNVLTSGHTKLYQICTKWDKRESHCKLYKAREYEFRWFPSKKKIISKWIVKTHSDANYAPMEVPLKRV